MTRTELLITLIKFRMARCAPAGVSEAETAQEAEAAVTQQGLRGWFGGLKARATPDGALVTNAESYVRVLSARGCLNGNTSDLTLARVNNEAIMSIEQHRRKRWPGISDFPVELGDYNYYRTRIEVMAEFGIEPEQMGLDRETIRAMTKIALVFFFSAFGSADPGAAAARMCRAE
jgi:hypothetical protein